MPKISDGVIMSKKEDRNSEIPQTRTLPKRIDKTIDWLEQSRDGWKNRCIECKSDLKVKTLAVKRLRDGKDVLKQRVKAATKEIHTIKSERDACSKEIERLKAELSAKELEITELKKKRSYIRKK